MDYSKWIDEHQSEILVALTQLIRIESVQDEPVTAADGSVYPFGAGVQAVLDKALAIGRELGFETLDVDHYGGHIEFPGSEETVMGIAGHLDVVPAAGKWSFEPYSGEVKDGYILGRGTTDDKGPVIACLYAMKALKECGFEPKSSIRLILGLDEETGWKGMTHYLDHVPAPDFGFTPDGEFPIIHGEKGNLIFELARKFRKTPAAKGLTLRSLKAGNAANSVPDAARAVLRNEKAEYEKIREAAALFQQETGYKVSCRGIGKSLELTTAGRGAHGANPGAGLNAISILMAFLGRLNFVNEDHNEWIDFYNRYIGFDLCGEKLGIALQDEKSGDLVLNIGKAEMNQEMGKLTVNIRYPVSFTMQQIFSKLEGTLERYQMGWMLIKHHAPLYLETEDPMVKTLTEVYRGQTGDTQSLPMVIGGGTYARAFKNMVAYGALFPGDSDLMHQPDEKLSVKRLMESTKIYAEAIYKLTSQAYNK